MELPTYQQIGLSIIFLSGLIILARYTREIVEKKDERITQLTDKFIESYTQNTESNLQLKQVIDKSMDTQEKVIQRIENIVYNK